MTVPSITTEDVREFIKDYPELNDLTGEEEFTPEQVERAIDFVVDDFNNTPPPIRPYLKAYFPFRRLLLYGIVGHLYFGAAFHQERNRLPVSTGGISVDDSARAQSYVGLANQLFTLYKEELLRIKISKNLEAGWGSIGSDYGYRR